MMQDKLWNGQLTVGSLRKVLEKLSDPLEVSYEEPARAMLWRVLLGVLPLPASLTATTCLDENYSVSQNWAATMDTMTRDYYNLKVNTMPSKDKVHADPLAGLMGGSSAGGSNDEDDEWTAYEKTQELKQFIEGDLDRLYLSGIDDEHFQDTERKHKISEVLLLWSTKNKNVSYRQGMHEIVAPILYALELEVATVTPEHLLYKQITAEGMVEAHSYYMFDILMEQLVAFYDPTPKKRGGEQQPEIVHYVTGLQERHLLKHDQALATHLLEENVYAQIYGMRWTRLMFGREFPMTHSHSFRIWDYMFAGAFNPSCSKSIVIASSTSSCGLRSLRRKRYGDVYGPLLDEIGDIALGMMINLRKQILEGDYNDAMMLLMRYPVVENVSGILCAADKLGNGTYIPPTSKFSIPVLGVGSPATSSSSGTTKQPSWLAATNVAGHAGGNNDLLDGANGAQSPTQPSTLTSSTTSSGSSAVGEEQLDAISPTAPMPVRVLKNAGKVAGNGIVSVGTNFLDGGRAVGEVVGGGLKSAVSALGAVGGVLRKNSITSSNNSFDPTDPFAKKSSVLDDLDDEPETGYFSPTKKWLPADRSSQIDKASESEDIFRDVASPAKKKQPLTIPPSVPISATSDTEKEVKQKATNAAIGDKLMDILDCLNNATSSERSVNAQKLRMLAALLDDDSCSGSLDEYNLIYPSAQHASASASAPAPASASTTVANNEKKKKQRSSSRKRHIWAWLSNKACCCREEQ